MSKKKSILADKLTNRFQTLEYTRGKIEGLFNASELSNRDVELVYEGLFLSAHSAFEIFIESLFVGLLLNKRGIVANKSNITPRVNINSSSIGYDLILGKGKQYVDWLPYKNTIDYANLFFRGGRPFTKLNDAQKDILQRCLIVRNAIAHKSDYSLIKFDKNIIASAALPTKEKSPAGYLRGYFRTGPNQTRYENYVAQLNQIANYLTH